MGARRQQRAEGVFVAGNHMQQYQLTVVAGHGCSEESTLVHSAFPSLESTAGTILKEQRLPEAKLSFL